MRKLLAQYRHTDRHPAEQRLGEAGPDGDTVDEIVQPIAEDDHPGDGGDHRITLLVLVVVHAERVGLIKQHTKQCVF